MMNITNLSRVKQKSLWLIRSVLHNTWQVVPKGSSKLTHLYTSINISRVL